MQPLPSIEDKVVQVADTFQPGKKSWKTLRAIGATISQPHEARFQNFIFVRHGGDSNLAFLKQSLDMMPGNDMERIQLLRLIVESHDFGDDWKAQVAYLDNALDIFPALDRDHMNGYELRELERKLEDVLIEKAQALRYAHQLDSAFEVLQVALEYRVDGMFSPNAISAINEVCQALDPSGHKFIGVLKSWTDKNWYWWFNWEYSLRLVNDELRKFGRWAKENAGDDFLLHECFPTIEKLSHEYKNTLCTLMVKSVLAYLHETVLGDVEKAKNLRLAVVTTRTKPDGWEQQTKACIVEEWIRLATLIYSEFQATTDLERRETLLKEMKELPRIHTGDDLKDAHIGMLLASMLRVVGPAREYYRYLNEAFETCIAGLEDAASYNDGPSLSLLARVLGSFEGLERDAQIAYSAQYSILDRLVEDNECKPHFNPFGRVLAPDIEASQPRSESAPESKPDETSATEGAVTSYLDSVARVPQSEVYSTPDSEDDERAWLEVEDRSGYAPSCDVCGYSFEDGIRSSQVGWYNPMYLCLTCPSTNLCQSCFQSELGEERAAVKPPEVVGFQCRTNHRYIKCPIHGRKGVKNGVMRMENEEYLSRSGLGDSKKKGGRRRGRLIGQIKTEGGILSHVSSHYMKVIVPDVESHQIIYIVLSILYVEFSRT